MSSKLNMNISWKRPESVEEWKALFKKYPFRAFGVIAVILYLGTWLFGEEPEKSKLSVHPHQHKPQIEGVQDAVDPRAAWSESLSQDMQNLLQEVTQKQEAASRDTENKLKVIIDEFNALKNHVSAQELANQVSTVRPAQEEVKPVKKTAAKLGFVHRAYEEKDKKNPEKYVTSGSFVRAVLLTGVVADTGIEAAGSPQPILLRLVDHGIFSKGYKTKQIKEAIIIGSCHGNVSSERALCRLEKLSLMNNDNKIIERPVEGWLIGEDGRPGIKGDVIDKSSDVTRMAVLNGILGGIAGFFQNQATSSVYPVSPIVGQSKALTGIESLKAGGAQGVGNALQKLADYAIKRAEQMSPVIVVGSGRVIDVVFKSGFELTDVTSIKSQQAKADVSFGNQNTPISSTEETANKQTRSMGYQQGIKSLNDLQIGGDM